MCFAPFFGETLHTYPKNSKQAIHYVALSFSNDNFLNFVVLNSKDWYNKLKNSKFDSPCLSWICSGEGNRINIMSSIDLGENRGLFIFDWRHFI